MPYRGSFCPTDVKAKHPTHFPSDLSEFRILLMSKVKSSRYMLAHMAYTYLTFNIQFKFYSSVGQKHKNSLYRAYGPLQEITMGKISYREFL
jgi:hypothetical protein